MRLLRPCPSVINLLKGAELSAQASRSTAPLEIAGRQLAVRTAPVERGPARMSEIG